MQVMNITTPANLFHALRRQLKRDFTMPLVIMSPKSLLRHPKCISSLDELSTSHFHEVIDDLNTKNVRRVLFCTGKIYYDLLAEKEQLQKQKADFVEALNLHKREQDQLTEQARSS